MPTPLFIVNVDVSDLGKMENKRSRSVVRFSSNLSTQIRSQLRTHYCYRRRQGQTSTRSNADHAPAMLCLRVMTEKEKET